MLCDTSCHVSNWQRSRDSRHPGFCLLCEHGMRGFLPRGNETMFVWMRRVSAPTPSQVPSVEEESARRGRGIKASALSDSSSLVSKIMATWT